MPDDFLHSLDHTLARMTFQLGIGESGEEFENSTLCNSSSEWERKRKRCKKLSFD